MDDLILYVSEGRKYSFENRYFRGFTLAELKKIGATKELLRKYVKKGYLNEKVLMTPKGAHLIFCVEVLGDDKIVTL